jgi:hypothetical protein
MIDVQGGHRRDDKEQTGFARAEKEYAKGSLVGEARALNSKIP